MREKKDSFSLIFLIFFSTTKILFQHWPTWPICVSESYSYSLTESGESNDRWLAGSTADVYYSFFLFLVILGPKIDGSVLLVWAFPPLVVLVHFHEFQFLLMNLSKSRKLIKMVHPLFIRKLERTRLLYFVLDLQIFVKSKSLNES